ncbi:MAG: tetratricopeptide repeat protein, partial [Gammaproteobacteria bacterium]|nr:tetratricopeptide repeat protein [Gammaproteobacteria bacterium]
QYKKVIKIQEQIHSPDHPRFDDAINILGKLYLTIGRYDDGYPYLERSLETRKKIYPPGHAWIANALLSFGHISAEVGKYAEGLAHLETSLALRQKRDGPDHFRTAIAYTTLGYIQHLVGQNRTAHDTLECARAIFQTQQVDTRNHALVLAYLGDALISLGDLETARLHLQNAFEIRQRIDGMKHMRMGITRVVMGTLEEATGHPEEALAHYQAAHDIFEGVVAPTHRYYVRAENALERA